MRLAATASMPQVRAEASYVLRELSASLEGLAEDAGTSDRAHYAMLPQDLERFSGREPVDHDQLLGPEAESVRRDDGERVPSDAVQFCLQMETP